MMSISRSDNRIEIAFSETRRVAMPGDAIHGAMLTSERLPCGRVAHAVLVSYGAAASPARIDGSLAEVAAVHDYVLERMMESAGDAHCYR